MEPATAAAAEEMREVFTEVVVASAFTPGALEALATRKNLRVVLSRSCRRCGPADPAAARRRSGSDRDLLVERQADFKVVGSREPTEAEWRDLMFA